MCIRDRNEIAPNLLHPGLNQKISELVKKTDAAGIKIYQERKNEMNQLDWGKRTYIMGVINITPDSFSGDGIMAHANPAKKALEIAHQFIEEGADILDIGAARGLPKNREIATSHGIGSRHLQSGQVAGQGSGSGSRRIDDHLAEELAEIRISGSGHGNLPYADGVSRKTDDC